MIWEINFEKLCNKPTFIKLITVRKDNQILYILLEFFHKVDKTLNQEFYQLSVHPIFIITKSEGNNYNEFLSYKNNQNNPFNKFQVNIDKNKKEVKFGPVGNIMLENFKSFGIGTYCLSLLVEILQTRFNDYKVLNGKLSSTDATPDNEGRRNNMYENIFPNVNLDEQGNGFFGANKVSELKQHVSKRVEIHDIDYFEFTQNYFKFENSISAKNKENIRLKENIKICKNRNESLNHSLFKTRIFLGFVIIFAISAYFI